MTLDKSATSVVDTIRIDLDITVIASILECEKEIIFEKTFPKYKIIKLLKRLEVNSFNAFTNGKIRLPTLVDQLPYRVHTNSELIMMVKGIKPLAVFEESYPLNSAKESSIESKFDQIIADRRFVKREMTQLATYHDPERKHMRTRPIRIVLYSLASEEWRIDAYILLKMTALKSGYGELYERMEGSLLGYTEWQNDAFIAMRAQ
ncbi:hypothetical protein [Caballeronia sordidicola]|uniref:hypothetical protein n=1 Tax=Caballeronia sordidicola TaxID=196367 RepID=UPI000B782965|nr:hypothetical protein [Caballeronia sordidicola]